MELNRSLETLRDNFVNKWLEILTFNNSINLVLKLVPREPVKRELRVNGLIVVCLWN